MQLGTIQSNSVKAGTCPHGMPLGACPICNGMSGGGATKKADFSAKAGEMSWNQCAAIGAMLKAREAAKAQHQQDAINHAQAARAFQDMTVNMTSKIANFASMLSQVMPTIIAKPLNFALNTIVGGIINAIGKIPTAIVNTVQNIQQKLADISDKLTAMFGELKASIDKKISEAFKNVKKKVKSLFKIFTFTNSDNEEKQIDETKKAFKLKTFIHDLYKKITKDEKNDN